MKLPVALESKSTLTKCTSLVSVVLISIRRIMDIPRTSRILVESRLGNLLSYFDFQGRVFLSRVEVRGAFIGSMISILISFTFNTENLFTNSNQGILFAGCTKQNPPLEQSTLPLLSLHLS